MAIEVKEGRYYRARNGTVWGPIAVIPLSGHLSAWCVGDFGYRLIWTKLGRLDYRRPHPLDLVEEVEIAPMAKEGETIPLNFAHDARAQEQSRQVAQSRDLANSAGAGQRLSVQSHEVRHEPRAKAAPRARAKRRGVTCCADGSCIYGHAGGMATNGGCQALKEDDPKALRRRIQHLRAIALELATELINTRDGQFPPGRKDEDNARGRSLWSKLEGGQPPDRQGDSGGRRPKRVHLA